MNVLLRRTWSALTTTRVTTHSQPPILVSSRRNTLALPCGVMQKRYASWSANQRFPKTKKKPEPKKKKFTNKYLLFNRRPRGRFPDIRPPQELLTEYLPDNATIRLGVARVHMANRKPLYDSVVNREVNILLSTPVRKVQFMGDLRKVSEQNIKELALPDWLKSGLIGLAKATPPPPPPTTSSPPSEEQQSPQ